MKLSIYIAICFVMLLVVTMIAYAKWLISFQESFLTFVVKYVCDIPIENEPEPVPAGTVTERVEKNFTIYKKVSGQYMSATESGFLENGMREPDLNTPGNCSSDLSNSSSRSDMSRTSSRSDTSGTSSKNYENAGRGLPGSDRPLYIVEIHGGAFVGGHRNVHRKYLRSLVSETGLPVVSVEYELAPNRRFPQTIWQIDDIIDSACPEKCDIILFGDSAGATHCMYQLLYSKSKTFQSLLGRENVLQRGDRRIVGFVSVSGYLDTELDQLNDNTFKEVYSILVSQYMTLEEAKFFNPIKFAGEATDNVKLLLTDSSKNSFASAMLQMSWRAKESTALLYNNPDLVHNFHFLADTVESKHFFRFLCDWVKCFINGETNKRKETKKET